MIEGQGSRECAQHTFLLHAEGIIYGMSQLNTMAPSARKTP